MEGTPFHCFVLGVPYFDRYTHHTTHSARRRTAWLLTAGAGADPLRHTHEVGVAGSADVGALSLSLWIQVGISNPLKSLKGDMRLGFSSQLESWWRANLGLQFWNVIEFQARKMMCLTQKIAKHSEEQAMYLAAFKGGPWGLLLISIHLHTSNIRWAALLFETAPAARKK